MITINTTKIEDGPKIEEIATGVFGPNYYQPPELDSEGNVFITARFNDSIVGFGLANIFVEKEIETLLSKPEFPSFLTESAIKKELGVIKTIAVSEEAQGKGLGSLIFSELEDRLRLIGAKRFLLPAWKDCKGIRIGRLADKKGYKQFVEINHFWKDDCDNQRFQCISRTDSCICSVVFYHDTYSYL
jgi:GNAT superfamily N-acetyltransferase